MGFRDDIRKSNERWDNDPEYRARQTEKTKKALNWMTVGGFIFGVTMVVFWLLL